MNSRILRAGLVLVTLAGWVLLATTVLAQQGISPICTAWTQVNDNAFGLDSGGSFASEEGFEVLVFAGQLYVGMEADNSLGARLWRTRADVPVARGQADWQEVIADANGLPFGVANVTQNDHVDSLAEFDGYLYVSTANGGDSTYGTRIFRSATAEPFATNPAMWEDAIASLGPGFGDVENTNFKDMQVFDGWLCGGTQNESTGTQVWCTQNGTTWVQKNASGFGAVANVTTWSGHVYRGALYWGVHNIGLDGAIYTEDDEARLYRTDDLSSTPASWTEVYSGTAGSRRVDILGDLGGSLYIAVRSDEGIIVLRSPSGDPGTWQQVNGAGMDGNPGNAGAVVDSATVYRDALYVSVFNLDSGFELWRTTGALQGGGPLVDWVQVGGSGLGDPDNLYAELIPFNGYLYAWTSNYATGQQVLRSDCDPVDHSQNQALRFYGHGVDGIDRVAVPIDAPAVPADVGGDFTLEWWMRASLSENGSGACAAGPDNWISGNILFDRDVWGAGDYGDYGVSLHGGVIAFGVNNGSSGAGICGATDVADDAWHHVAVTRDQASGQLRIYVDGRLDGQGAGPTGDLSYRDGRATAYEDDPYLVIAAEKHDAGPAYPSYSGLLDEVRLSNVVRYSGDFTPPDVAFASDANTVALYHLDEGAGNVVNDVAGAAGGPSTGLRRYGGTAPAGPAWVPSAAPLAGPAAEPVQPVVDIARVANDVQLTWQHHASNVRYEVWRSTAPCFAFDGVGSTKVAEVLAPLSPDASVLFVDGGALGDPATNYFYAVRAVNSAGATSAASSTVGEFDFALAPGEGTAPAGPPPARYVILMIADGWGIKHIEAANAYSSSVPAYQSWPCTFMSTYPAGGGYDPAQAWTNFDYVKSGTTDSAAAATALYTGVKTANGRIGVSADGDSRLYAISEKARSQGRATGAVSTVYISHATPGAWMAHNSSRSNGYAIADEGLWGDPNTTGTILNSIYYGGGQGVTLPPLDVVIGAGHPDWRGGNYVNAAIRDKLAAESGLPAAFTFVERIAGSPDGGARLLAAAADPSVTRLAGLFGGSGGNLEYRLADGSGHDPENPTLAEMTAAALAVLGRDPDGFVLMVEGGAVDWASHGNRMDRMIGELLGFNEAVQTVIDWVEDPANGSSWDNTLVIITGDHETGYLTAGPSLLPDRPLGAVNAGTLALEKEIGSSGRRASWDDADGDDEIDPGEAVYWAWNSGGHTNSLIPVYARGAGAYLLAQHATSIDPVRGAYLDNTAIHAVMDAVLVDVPAGSGVLQWGTCQGEVVLDTAAAAVATGSRVELWDVGVTPPQRLAMASIGDGGLAGGQFEDSVILDLNSYTLQVRVYDSADPASGDPASCAVVLPGFDPDSPDGLVATLDPLETTTVCVDGAQIPVQSYTAGQGGCGAPAFARCADFAAPVGVEAGDLAAVARQWGQDAPAGTPEARYDLNRDGVISIIDILAAAAQWGYACL